MSPRMTRDPKALAPSEVRAINETASVLMKQGIRRLDDGDQAAIVEALSCFDRALDMRRGLPIDDDPLLRYGLAACLLNRGDALIRLGDAGRMVDALAAFDEGIDVMRALPLTADARFPRRLAMACHNRGLALQAMGRPVAEPIAAFADALAILDDDQASGITDRQYLLAVVLTNLASARVVENTAESAALARAAARRAIALVDGAEAGDASAAEVGLKARHVLCHTIAVRLSAPAASDDPMPEDVHEATDIADEGLDLVRQWEKKGVARFRAIACDLFRFGTVVYATFQPQFLNEFVREHLDPNRSSAEYVSSPEMRAAVEEALERWGPRKDAPDDEN
jgi:tetratricopeptide (TPR) repeat protein